MLVFHCAHTETDTFTMSVSPPLVHVAAQNDDARHSAILTAPESYALAVYVEWLLEDSDREEPTVDLPELVAPVLTLDEEGNPEPALWLNLRVESDDFDAEPIEIVFDLSSAHFLASALHTAAVSAACGFTDPGAELTAA